VGHHSNAALLGGRDQKFHCDLPMLAFGFGRRQGKDINVSIAYGSKFATASRVLWCSIRIPDWSSIRTILRKKEE
jgi:hypothetical protein